MIVTEYMNLGALDDFLRVSGWSPGWERGTDVIFFSSISSLFSWGLGLGIVPTGQADLPLVVH